MGLFYLQFYFSYYLHIVVTTAQYTCDRVLKRVLKLSTYRLQIFLLKYNYVKFFNKLMQRKLNFGRRKYCFLQIP